MSTNCYESAHEYWNTKLVQEEASHGTFLSDFCAVVDCMRNPELQKSILELGMTACNIFRKSICGMKENAHNFNRIILWGNGNNSSCPKKLEELLGH